MKHCLTAARLKRRAAVSIY